MHTKPPVRQLTDGLFCALAFSVSVVQLKKKQHFLHLFCLPQSFIHSVVAFLSAKNTKPPFPMVKSVRSFSRPSHLNLAHLLGRLGCAFCHSFLHVAPSSPPFRTQKLTPNTCVVQLFFLVNVRKTPFYSGHSRIFHKLNLLLVPPRGSLSLFGSAFRYHLRCTTGSAPLFVQTPQGLGSVFLRKGRLRERNQDFFERRFSLRECSFRRVGFTISLRTKDFSRICFRVDLDQFFHSMC